MVLKIYYAAVNIILVVVLSLESKEDDQDVVVFSCFVVLVF